MFNTITNVRCPDVVRINVEERRAPTDESIRLADEIHEKTLDRILSVDLFDNVVKGKLTWHVDRAMRRERCVASFKINGKEYHYDLPVDTTERFRAGRNERELVEFVRQRASEAVVGALLSQSFPDMKQAFTGLGTRDAG